MKIVVLDGYTANPGDLSWGPLEALGQLTVYPNTRQEDAAAAIGDAQAVILNRLEIGRELMDACPRLRYIGMLATGYNRIDLAAANERGITVCNVPGYSTNIVAQHTIALLLALTNHVAGFDREVKAGNWEGAEGLAYPLTELYGKSFGAVGFGQIGRAAARIARAMGMEILAAGSRPNEEGLSLGKYVSLDELYSRADVVSLHCPLTDKTKGMIGRASLAKMKPGVLLLNTARGGLVDEAALAEALLSGHVKGAGVDGTVIEPVPVDSPLLAAPRCLITPHIAWSAHETRGRLIRMVADNLRAYKEGKPVHVVNTPMLEKKGERQNEGNEEKGPQAGR